MTVHEMMMALHCFDPEATVVIQATPFDIIASNITVGKMSEEMNYGDEEEEIVVIH